MSTTQSPEEMVRERIEASVTRGARRFGYLLAAAINGLLLWVAHQLPEWGWPGFLTPEYDDLLPILTFSFVASIAANLVYAVADRWPVKPVGEVLTAAIGFVVAVRVWQVFPFDFSDHDTDWSWLVRAVLVIAIVGAAIGFVVELSRLARRPVPAGESSST